ncbi:HER088Wp [Eremothecium sinecaudum]|uniref:HER088Wp n=1 Tax=Eremothecium sinecaudum TaxID=45286 RepID=A0A0X8HTR9_9SACH|nr:HER088Wp [Eremothecium sinecaudum]AMD21367.1 HER088Wp [Eremothecium sinecaudum]
MAVKIVGHRAYKADPYCPENTLQAYDRAYEAKVDIIETDIQLTADGVVVISHDMDTARMYNEGHVISQSNWSSLKALHIKGNVDITMPSLKDSLEWLTKHDNVTLMIDIKPTNSKVIIAKAISDMMAVVNDIEYWRKRIIFGLWDVSWYEFGVVTGAFKSFRVLSIGISMKSIQEFIDYSKKLNEPVYKLYGISLHFVGTWSDTFQEKWLPILKENNLKLFLWTVNKDIDVKYVSALPVDGIVTDNPVNMRESVKKWTANPVPFSAPPAKSKEGIRFYCYLTIYKLVVRLVFSPWANYKVLRSYSIASLFMAFLRRVHFI